MLLRDVETSRFEVLSSRLSMHPVTIISHHPTTRHSTLPHGIQHDHTSLNTSTGHSTRPHVIQHVHTSIPIPIPGQHPITRTHRHYPGQHPITRTHLHYPGQHPITRTHIYYPGQHPIARTHQHNPCQHSITRTHQHYPGQHLISRTHQHYPGRHLITRKQQLTLPRHNINTWSPERNNSHYPGMTSTPRHQNATINTTQAYQLFITRTHQPRLYVNTSLLLLLKFVGNARLTESDIHPISPKTPATQYQPTYRKKRKGKIVKYFSCDRAA